MNSDLIRQILIESFETRYGFLPSTTSLDLLLESGFDSSEHIEDQIHLSRCCFNQLNDEDEDNLTARIMAFGSVIEGLSKKLDFASLADWNYCLADSEYKLSLIKGLPESNKMLVSAMEHIDFAYGRCKIPNQVRLRARIATALNNWDKAVESYDWLVEHQELGFNTWTNIGHCLFMQGNYKRTIATLGPLIDDHPRARNMAPLGWAYIHVGQVNKGLELLEKSMTRLSPEYSDAFGHILIRAARFLKEQNEFQGLKKLRLIFDDYINFTKEGQMRTQGTTRVYFDLKHLTQ